MPEKVQKKQSLQLTVWVESFKNYISSQVVLYQVSWLLSSVKKRLRCHSSKQNKVYDGNTTKSSKWIHRAQQIPRESLESRGFKIRKHTCYISESEMELIAYKFDMHPTHISSSSSSSSFTTDKMWQWVRPLFKSMTNKIWRSALDILTTTSPT
jgi:hypothetical protein